MSTYPQSVTARNGLDPPRPDGVSEFPHRGLEREPRRERQVDVQPAAQFLEREGFPGFLQQYLQDAERPRLDLDPLVAAVEQSAVGVEREVREVELGPAHPRSITITSP